MLSAEKALFRLMHFPLVKSLPCILSFLPPLDLSWMLQAPAVDATAKRSPVAMIEILIVAGLLIYLSVYGSGWCSFFFLKKVS